MAKRVFKYKIRAYGIYGKIEQVYFAPNYETAKKLMQSDHRKRHGKLTKFKMLSKVAMKKYPHPL